MTRVPVTDDVVEQLRDVLEADLLDDEHNHMGAGFAAQDLGHEELAQFIYEADAATYYEALERARNRLESDA
ncbi:hypothetical protein [Natronomonas sp. LN261]|jgi:hypothetical protein|uniref:hypothetical protein n=1 Tax=Natronomonas sp. LN261 TaxID=2750669 RepID=UPI0015EEEC86|nr:hypothetical protein [Natronomonas sp. LN261]